MAVTGYWLIKDQKTGHAAMIKATSSSTTQTPVISDQFKQQLGAGKNDYFTSYYLTSDPNKIQDRLFAALGALQVNADQIPTAGGYGDLLSKGIQRINFDLLTPIGVNANQYQAGISKAGNTVAAAGNLLAGLAGTAVRALMALAGFALVLLGLQALTGTGAEGNPVQAVRSARR